ncbi:hypothetical protein [Streptomyces tremellae]|uniref:Uncharacterized protein n=1 Tax=Streptomyces tremellae TaxID=1124239 RepID=A0ABP7EXN9_9ACTN
MATIGYAQLPVPAGGDAPTVPAAVAELATALDPHLVQHVTDQADRDNRLAAAPVSTLALAADGSAWTKTSTTNTWFTLAEPLPDWAPMSLASGMEADQDAPQYRIIGQQVWMRGSIRKTDGSLLPLAGVQVATVPDEAIPRHIGRLAAGASLTGDAAIGVGRVEVLASSTGLSQGPGAVMWYSQDGSGVTWCDISGSYWLD